MCLGGVGGLGGRRKSVSQRAPKHTTHTHTGVFVFESPQLGSCTYRCTYINLVVRTFLFFLFSFLREHKKHANGYKRTKIKKAVFYALKKHLRGKKSLIHLFAFLCFLCFCLVAFLCFLCLFLLFVLFVSAKSFRKKKEFKIALMTSFTLLLKIEIISQNLFFFTHIKFRSK